MNFFGLEYNNENTTIVKIFSAKEQNTIVVTNGYGIITLTDKEFEFLKKVESKTGVAHSDNFRILLSEYSVSNQGCNIWDMEYIYDKIIEKTKTQKISIKKHIHGKDEYYEILYFNFKGFLHHSIEEAKFFYALETFKLKDLY